MSELDKKIDKLDKELSARQQAKDKPSHIGKKLVSVLQQEYFSLINGHNPETLTKSELESFRIKWFKLEDEILRLDEGSLVLASFESKYGSLGRIERR